MNDDDIILQPDASKTEDVKEEVGKTQEDAVPPESTVEDSLNPRVFDFSSDFNISPVASTPPTDKKQDKDWPFAFGNAPTKQPLMNPAATASAPIAAAMQQSKPKPPAAPEKPQMPPTPQPPKAAVTAPAPKPAPAAMTPEAKRSSTNLERDIFAILPNLNPNKDSEPGPVRSNPSNPLYAKIDDAGIKPLRTFEGDVAEAMSHMNSSAASIAIAENKRRTGENRIGNKEEPKKHSFSLFKKKEPTFAPKATNGQFSQSMVESAPNVEREPQPEPEAEPEPVIIEEKFVPKPQPKPEPIAVVPPPMPKPAPAPMPVVTPAARAAAFRQDAFPPKPEGETFKGAYVAPPEEPKAPSHFVRNVSVMLLSVLLIGGGAFGGYYLYTKSALWVKDPATPSQNQTASIKSLIPADSQIVISTDGQNAQSLAERIRSEAAKPQPLNTIKEIVLTQSVSGSEKQVSPMDAARAMNIPVPDVVLRTIQPKWMLGVHADASGMKNIFLAATTDNFQNALSGMLRWESAMPRDLNAYINTTSTTTLQGTFIDEIVRNKDVRAFVAPGDEKTLFLYSFVSDSLIVVSTSEVALSEIVIRLENQAFVR